MASSKSLREVDILVPVDSKDIEITELVSALKEMRSLNVLKLQGVIFKKIVFEMLKDILSSKKFGFKFYCSMLPIT